MSKIYRYRFDGARLTTADLLDGFSQCQSSGCSTLILEGVRGNYGTYSFILQPIGVVDKKEIPRFLEEDNDTN